MSPAVILAVEAVLLVPLPGQRPVALGDGEDLGAARVQILRRRGCGQQTFISFSQGERNPELDQSEFQFTPPEGVDVLGAEELDLGDITSRSE